MVKKILGIILVFALVTLYIYLWFVNPARHHLRFQDTHLNTHLLVHADASFQDYVNASHAMVKQARQRGGVDYSDKVVAENAPVIMMPDEKICKKSADNRYENGVLLIHGLLDSTYTMQYLGQFFQQKCFVVYIVLLPGHGTVPGDLLHVSYHDWVNVTHFAVTRLTPQVKNTFIMGYSLGGLLAINEVLESPGLFKAAILFGPALGINSPYTSLVRPVYELSQFVPRLQWLSLRNDDINVRYESYPVNSVYQIIKLMNKVHSQLSRRSIEVPIFMQQSADDMTIDPLMNLEFFEKNLNGSSKLLWYSQNPADKHLTDMRIKLIDGSVPEMKILDMSHLSYLLPEADPIYGMNGSYHDCLYYTEQSAEWLQCKKGVDNFLGENTPENVKTHLLQRLSFNPFDKQMFDELGKFVDSVAKIN
jgi:esterase/lipase